MQAMQQVRRSCYLLTLSSAHALAVLASQLVGALTTKLRAHKVVSPSSSSRPSPYARRHSINHAHRTRSFSLSHSPRPRIHPLTRPFHQSSTRTLHSHTARSSSSTHTPTLHTHTPSSFSRPRHELDFSATLTATLRPFPRPSPSYDFDSTSTPVTDTHRLHLSALHYHVYEHTISPLARHRLFDCNCIPVFRLRIQ